VNAETSRVVRFVRRTAKRALAGPQSSLSGWVDTPSEAGTRADSILVMTGWALTDRPGQKPRVAVLLDGVVVAETEASEPRPDLTALFGHHLSGGGWRCELRTTRSDIGSRLIVTATDGISHTTLDSRRILDRRGGVDGRLDSPAAAQRVTVGGVLRISGWAILDGSPADRIAAFIGDEPPISVRRAQPRPDVIHDAAASTAASTASGFAEIVVVPERWEGQSVDVVIRAYSESGDVWTSPVCAVGVDKRPERTETLDEVVGEVVRHGTSRGRRDGERLRVCVFTHSLNLGGGELYLQELLLRLQRDHPVEILLVTPLDGPLKQQLRDAGVTVHITNNYPVDATHYLGRITELGALITSWGTDVVLVNTLGVFPAVDAALEVEVPVVWAIHESFSLGVFSFLNWGEHGLHPMIEARWRRCLAEAHTVFEADATLKMFAEEVPALQGRRIQYGIDVAEIAQYRREHDREQLRARLGFETRHTVLLCMGVFQERKSQLALVLAFARLAPLFPDARLVLVGDHPSAYAGSVRDAVAELMLQDQVQVIPIQPDTYRWYHAADVLVSASDTESLPRSILEAMAFGLPTLAADVFGVPEVVRDGVNGWLCRPRSSSSLVAGLRRALDFPAERRLQLSERCLADAPSFDGARYPAEYFQLMSSLVSFRTPEPR
jgi:D-inositol-3-phosphate glycosyltransferase